MLKCPICFEIFRNNDMLFAPCVDAFCHSCYRKLLNNRSTEEKALETAVPCPICRNPISYHGKAIILEDDEEASGSIRHLIQDVMTNTSISCEEFCHLCGRSGHRPSRCKKRAIVFHSNVLKKRRRIACTACGRNGHRAKTCRVDTGVAVDMSASKKEAVREKLVEALDLAFELNAILYD